MVDGNGQRVKGEKATGIRRIADRHGVATINALGYRMTTVFDAVGQTNALNDPTSRRNTFLYDGAGHKIALIDPLFRRTTQGFDGTGRQVTRTDSRGNRTTYPFDSTDQLLGRKYPDGKCEMHFDF